MKYQLKDFNVLAYNFAIRNPDVIQLLSEPFTEDNRVKLRGYGFLTEIAEAYKIKDGYEDENKYECRMKYSLDALYLDYEHLNIPQVFSDEGSRKLSQPSSGKFLVVNRISMEDEIVRINSLFETRGRANKLDRLMSGEVFEHYDAVSFRGKTIYSLDPSTNKKKTIQSDIELVKEWIQPDKYFQLLPLQKEYIESLE